MTSKPPVILVTGAARRIGAAIISKFHAAGFNVIIHYHTSAREAQKLADKLNIMRKNSAITLPCDLATIDSISAAEKLLENIDRLDILVNNASMFHKSTSLNPTLWDLMFHVNVRAPWYLAEATFPLLQKSAGTIINITDTHTHKALRDYEIYCQTKAALGMQTMAQAAKFAPKVRVNAIAPGLTILPEQENSISTTTLAHITARTLLQTCGDPAYLADAVHAIAINPFITGQTLKVDGGRL